MENVISFETKQPVPVSDVEGILEEQTVNVQEEVLKAASEIKFDDLLVIGRETGTNLIHFYSINREYPSMLWLLESAKLQVMSPQAPLRG